MDFVEINKYTQEKKVRSARDNMYNLSNMTKQDSTVLVLYACRKLYGLKNTVKIVHGLGIKKL